MTEIKEPENFVQMVERHEREIQDLQMKCSHQRWGWVRRSNALMCGLLIRYEVKLCGKCNKELGRRHYCAICGKQLTIGEWKEADGTEGRPMGTIFCQDCWLAGAKIDLDSILKRK